MLIFKYRNVFENLLYFDNYGLGLTSFKFLLCFYGLNAFHKILHNFDFLSSRISNIDFIVKDKNNRFLLGDKRYEELKERRKILKYLNIERQFRYEMCLPCNGQRTKTNARTAKERRNLNNTIKIEEKSVKILINRPIFKLKDLHFRRKKKKILEKEAGYG